MLNEIKLIGKIVSEPKISGNKVSFKIINKREYEHEGIEHEDEDVFEIVAFEDEAKIKRLLKCADLVLIIGIINVYKGELQIIAESVKELKKSL